MSQIPVLGIPHYNRGDLLARCLVSIDYPVKKLVIVENGDPSERVQIDGNDLYTYDVKQQLGPDGVRSRIPAGKWRSELIGEIVTIEHPNAGVAGSWNEIIKLFPAPWWLISNNDIQFAPGDLEKMANAVWRELRMQGETTVPAGLIYGNHGASWFAMTGYGLRRAGFYDENFYPAYLEDCDMSRRMDLLGLRRFDVPDVHAVHGDEQQPGSCTVNANPEIAEANSRTHGNNFDYYREKWGGLNGTETFSTPFNDPNWPVWAWKFCPVIRSQQQWQW